MEPSGSWLLSAVQVLSILIVVVACQIGLSGYCFNHMDVAGRLVFLAATLLNVIFLFSHNIMYFFPGAAVFAVALFWQYNSNRQSNGDTALAAGE